MEAGGVLPASINTPIETLNPEQAATVRVPIRAVVGTPALGAFCALGLMLVLISGVAIRFISQNQPLPIDIWWHDLLAVHRNVVADAVAQMLNPIGGTRSMVIITAALLAVLEKTLKSGPSQNGSASTAPITDAQPAHDSLHGTGIQ